MSNCKVVNNYIIGADIGREGDISVIVVGRIVRGQLEIVETREVDLRDQFIQDRNTKFNNEVQLVREKFATTKLLKGRRTNQYPLCLSEVN